jgi:hypothetical protein
VGQEWEKTFEDTDKGMRLKRVNKGPKGFIAEL